ncbi:MAG: N-acetyl-1-D-myo-inositol-2-amino-2-deoxy-alpha-D-glucopyranoside deacetylase [Actinomycetota bacterium]
MGGRWTIKAASYVDDQGGQGNLYRADDPTLPVTITEEEGVIQKERARPRVLMAVHAHPDDEGISTGGVLARYARLGVRTVLVTATRGEVGEIVDPELAHHGGNLGEYREQELRCAAGILGVSDLRILGYRDSGMAGTPENSHPECLHQADPAEVAARLVATIREVRPDVVVTYDENGGYGHPDHVAVHRATVLAFGHAGDPLSHPEAGPAWSPAKLYYTAFPIRQILEAARLFREAGQDPPFGDWTEERPPPFGTPDELVTTRVDIGEYMDAKRTALSCHRTQIALDSRLLRRIEGPARHAFSHEYFRLVRGPKGPADDECFETDLFAGL